MPEVAPRWELSLAAEPASIPQIRGGVTEFAVEHGVDRELIGDIALAVTEAATNAVLHAFVDRSAGTVTAIAETGPDAIIVSVVDNGRGMMPRPDSPGLGLGIPTITQLAASCDIRAGHGGS